MRILLICLMLLAGNVQAKDDCNECCQKAKIEALIEKSIEVGRDGDWDASLELLDAALLIDEQNARTISIKASVYFGKEEYEKSIELLNHALNVDKSNPVLLSHEHYGILDSIGVAYSKLEQYDKAVHSYTESLKLNHKGVWTYKRRAEAYIETQQFSKALEDYNQIVKIDQKSKKAIVDDIAYIYLEMGDYQKALDVSEEAKSFGVELDEGFYTELEELREQ